MTTLDARRITELVERQRRIFGEVMAARPLGADVRLRETAIGRVAALEVLAGDAPAGGTMLWIHGGAFVAGSPRSAVAPAANVAHAAGIRAVSIDYRLAPEHPHPVRSRTRWPPIAPSSRRCQQETWWWAGNRRAALSTSRSSSPPATPGRRCPPPPWCSHRPPT